MDEYQILGSFTANKNPLNKNKIKILRTEIKDIVSPLSLKLIGSILYCDSFSFCHEEIQNLTHDILPIKCFYTSHMHMHAKDNYMYEPIKIIKQNTNVKFTDIQYKAIAFNKEEYNIPYLFPSSKNLGFESDQMFVAFEGKMAVFNDCFIFYENSLGIILIEEENLLEIQYKEESNFSLLLVKVKDSDKIPLSGIIKNEILLYLYAANSSLRSYKFEMIDFLKKRFKAVFKNLSASKYEEYDIAIKTLDENKYLNLNYISNTFCYANVLDSFYELLDYESFKTKFYGFAEYSGGDKALKLPFAQYKENIARASVDLVTSINNTKKDKIVFFYCDILTNNSLFNFNANNNSNNVIELVRQLALTQGANPIIVAPSLELLGEQQKLFDFYVESFSKAKVSKKNNTVIACVFNNYKVRNFMGLLTKKFYTNFFDDFEILNFVYCVNLEFTKANRNKAPAANLYTFNDQLFGYLVTEDDLVLPGKMQQRSKLLAAINAKASVLNTRSFTRNVKEAKQIFEFSNKDFKFILDNYVDKNEENKNNKENIQQNNNNSNNNNFSNAQSDFDTVFIELEYKLNREILTKYIKHIINHPLLYTQQKHFFLKSEELSKNKEKKPLKGEDTEPFGPESTEYLNVNAMMTDKEYQDELAEEIKKIKSRASEGEIISVIGKVCFFNDDAKFILKANYSDLQLIKIENEKKANFEEKEKFGILFVGKNLQLNLNNLRNFVYTLSGELPQFKKYKTKADMSEQEIMNLNLLYFEKELPEGWYLDGPVFVDPQDNRCSFHPRKQNYFFICYFFHFFLFVFFFQL